MYSTVIKNSSCYTFLEISSSVVAYQFELIVGFHRERKENVKNRVNPSSNDRKITSNFLSDPAKITQLL